MSKAKKADIEALKKAHDEYEKKRKEAEQFNKKLFPNGVLEKDPTAPAIPFTNPLAVMQARNDLRDLVESSLAEKLQAVEEKEKERQAASHKTKFENGLNKFLKYCTENGIVLKEDIKASQIEKICDGKKIARPNDTKIIRGYLKHLFKNKKGS